MSRVNLKEKRPQRVPRVRVQCVDTWGVGGSTVLQWSDGQLWDIKKKNRKGTTSSLAVQFAECVTRSRCG